MRETQALLALVTECRRPQEVLGERFQEGVRRLEHVSSLGFAHHTNELSCHAWGNIIRHGHGPTHLTALPGLIGLHGQLMHTCGQVSDRIYELAAGNVRSFTQTPCAETAETTTQQRDRIGWVLTGLMRVRPVEDAIILQNNATNITSMHKRLPRPDMRGKSTLQRPVAFQAHATRVPMSYNVLRHIIWRNAIDDRVRHTQVHV